MKKLLYPWNSCIRIGGEDAPTRSEYGMDWRMCKAYIMPSGANWYYAVFAKSYSFVSSEFFITELEGLTDTKYAAMKIVDDYLISQGWILIDREPQLAILL